MTSSPLVAAASSGTSRASMIAPRRIYLLIVTSRPSVLVTLYRSSVLRDPHLGAVPLDGAAATEGRDRLADVLAEADQEIVEDDPVPPGELQSQRLLRLFGRAGLHIPPAVWDPMDMGVHADPRLAVPNRDHQIGCLPPDPFELQELIQVIGHPASILCNEGPTDPADHLGLGAVEPDRIDQPGDCGFAKGKHRGRRVGASEEAGRGLAGYLVLGPETQEARDQDPEGVTGLCGYLSHGGGVPPPHCSLQGAHNRVNVGFFHRRSS